MIANFVTKARHVLFAAIPTLLVIQASTHWLPDQVVTGILAILGGLGLYSAPDKSDDALKV